ncbi:sugar ABC transporter permease [Bifidobacterium sp. W8109]|uniref:carbohydrate ABC transporter permease n=1 Tax=Bifidobacterium TaxID=1678 RepID=UPI0018DC29D0|nr:MULTISPECIES: sugar ABC transporter permease [Bifidobacterium]MBH9972064.1 sugar ABC transporter permease [Bifidobacterium asteroides]MBH9981034.1 sugar ABC transporter permease [Bifidobacterium asteroides]MBI0073765.1 sugar ABC transporter permease [Bifidobacterium sp. W8110]MBI0100204.1 sugar ABC transporter permease [Bifidobacterium sp. W8114]
MRRTQGNAAEPGARPDHSLGKGSGSVRASARIQKRRSRFRGASINFFYLPAVLLLIVFIIYPLISGIRLSLTNWDGYSDAQSFVGLANYKQMLTDANFKQIVINTFIYGIGSTAIQQVLGLALALMLNKRIKGRTLWRAIIYLPALVAPVIMGIMYYFVFQYRQGALNAFLGIFGIHKIAWFNNAGLSVAIVVIVNSIQFVGVSMIIYLAGLQTMDQQVVEAAEVDGAYGWKKFWNITLPLLAPSFTTSVVLNLIGGLKLYDMIKVLTGGGPGYATNSVSTYISTVYFDNQAAGYASAIGVFLFVLIAVVTWLINKGLAKLDWEA